MSLICSGANWPKDVHVVLDKTKGTVISFQERTDIVTSETSDQSIKFHFGDGKDRVYVRLDRYTGRIQIATLSFTMLFQGSCKFAERQF